jgi:hypothetical protein
VTYKNSDIEGRTMNCAFCHGELDTGGRVGRKDTCPYCKRDLRCCRQCKFYDPKAYNSCREVSAHRIIDKERANLCDYFVLRGSPEAVGRVNRAKEAKKALEALFKKK